jgi:hypothetical protein
MALISRLEERPLEPRDGSTMASYAGTLSLRLAGGALSSSKPMDQRTERFRAT